MTKEMCEDLSAVLRQRIKTLTALVIVFAILFVGMSIFAFSEIEITIETDEQTKVEQEADTNGDNSAITQEGSIQSPQDNTYLICGTVILCVLIVTIGVIVYGKSKANNYVSKKDKDNY